MITLFLNELKQRFGDYRPYKELLKRFRNSSFPIEIEGPEGFVLAMLLDSLHRAGKGYFLVVMPGEKEAETLVRDLLLLTDRVHYFPWWETLPYEGSKPQAHIRRERLHHLTRMIRGESCILVTSLRTFLSPLPPPGFIAENIRTISIGDPLDPVEMSDMLQRYGYLRVPKVSVPGEFALRGEVLDIFLAGEELALRTVFEYDQVEEIKFFDAESQTSVEQVKKAHIHPAGEILWDSERIESLKRKFPEMSGTLKELEERGWCADEEFLFPHSFEKAASLAEYLQPEGTLMMVGTERLEHAREVIKKEYRELHKAARIKRIPAAGLSPDLMLLDSPVQKSIHPRTIQIPALKDPDTSRIRFPMEGPRSFFGNIIYLKEELENLISSGYEIFIFSESESQGKRIEHLVKDFEVTVIPAGISSGFTLPELKIMVIQENEIFGRRQRAPASVKRVKSAAIDTFVELNPGDYVVHVNYGIGRFKGIDRIKAAGTERDYIELEYAGDETIFIPIEQVNLVQRYIGQEGRSVRLDKIGGKSWENRKSHVRKSVEDLAERLVALYARRRQAAGFAFSEDTDWQTEFEAEFPFEETVDQLKCIEDVKGDMESPRPMDRLICGDVGYGKTEIAMRAVFKAVISGKQAAILAPTTILTEQHYENFTERFNRYPVRISMLSRFVSKTDQKKVLERLRTGETDLVIGTHRLLQKDVSFKNLGLLVVDEEQRFGVKDKERLKELKASVDCLTLSATPIPRTLHMSLMKIRDMSLLTTAPHNRLPIETHIQEFNEDLIADAVRKEIARGGQVFFLHNRVETLPHTKQFIEKLVPEVLVETAHGQMSPHDLEDIMHRFIHGAFHVLAATTIIENGIDIPNVNTIVIDRADMYGISQLYQLRGRVGRSDRLAYAYLLFPDKRAISEIAMKRLSIISDHTELGSGFKIAMKDMEVRGAGNLLGRQQHGEILSVGFDMYLRILEQAVADLSEEKKDEAPEVYLELDYSGYIPDSYISDATEKMEIYKKIASIQTDEDLERIVAELHDRFGPMPDEVSSLLSIAEVRIICRKLFIGSLRERKGEVRIEFGKLSIINVDKVLRLIRESGGSVRPDSSQPHMLLMNTQAISLKDKSEFIREKLQVLL